MIDHLESRGVNAIFHYVPLHSSPYAKRHFDSEELPNATRFFETLIRLPLYCGLEDQEVDYVIESVRSFFAVAQSNRSLVVGE